MAFSFHKLLNVDIFQAISKNNSSFQNNQAPEHK